MKYHQKDIVEVMYPVGNNQLLPHPALIISADEVYDVEEYYIMLMLSTSKMNPDFAFELTPNMFNYKTDKISFAKCQLIEIFEENEIRTRFGSLKNEAFQNLLTFMNKVTFNKICK